MSSVLTSHDGVPEIRPLTTVEDLLAWRPSEEESRFCRSVQPLAPKSSSSDRPRVLCCHDMRGGYLEDRFLQGGGDGGGYVFRHWDKIDTFVYFSHNLVTVPPPGWTNAAHLHGVPILGTFITEWAEGTASCEKFLANDAVCEHFAHQLASLAAFLGFDGWVINIENEIASALIPRLLHFVKCLTKATHASLPTSGTVIW